MPILNAHLDWKGIVVSHPEVGHAFRGTPGRTLLAANSMLCRFITTESKKKGIPGNHVFFSPWWMEWTTTVGMLSSFKAVAPRDVVRAKLAVIRDFSRELDSLVQIILTEPVYAWKGFAQYQNDDASRVTRGLKLSGPFPPRSKRHCSPFHRRSLHRRRDSVLPAEPRFRCAGTKQQRGLYALFCFGRFAGVAVRNSYYGGAFSVKCWMNHAYSPPNGGL